MTYVEEINRAIREQVGAQRRLVCFGQNISAGSCLAGLTRDLPRGGGVEVIDTPNCENGLVAFGFGMMMEGVDSIFFVKQIDFLLLACDQLVNTLNMTRLQPRVGSFTIVPIVVDSGFEGPQSRLNNLADLCSLTDIPGFALPEVGAARQIVAKHLVAPGARILAVSQRLLRSKPGDARAEPVTDDASVFRLADGADATIVAFNFSWECARQLRDELAERGTAAALFGVAACDPSDWGAVADSVARTGRLVVLDDSRSRNRPADRLRAALIDWQIPHAALPLYRPISADSIPPNADRFEVDARSVHAWLGKTDADSPRGMSDRHG